MRTFFTRMTLVGWIAAGCFAAMPARADYTVTGKFQYQDREFDLSGYTGVTTPRPVRFADVKIVSGDTTLATGATLPDGNFSVTVPGSVSQPIVAVCVTSSSATPGLLLDLRVANDDFTFGDFYSVASAPVNASGSGTVDMGITTAISSTDAGKVFNIWDLTIDALQFLASPNAHGAPPAARLTVIWRQTHAQTTSFFSGGSTKFMYIGATAAFDDTVISHEFGHYMDNLYSKSDSPGGQHFLGNNNQDMRLSWGEGLATFLGSSIRKFKGYPCPDFYVSTDGNKLSFSYEIETLSGNIVLGSKTGSTNEVAVTAALWDITDGPDTADATPGVDDDPLQRPLSDVWKVLTQYLPTITRPGITIETFWDGWFDPNIRNGSIKEMQEVFARVNGIEFIEDDQEPDNSASAAPLVITPQIPGLTSGSKVVINELEMGSVDAIELYNAGDVEADITGWTVQASAPGYPTALFEIPPFKLAAGSFVILSEAAGHDTDFVLHFGSNISWENGKGGAFALRDASGTGRDFVRWGDSKEAIPAGTGFNGPNPPSPPAGKTLGRDYAATDTDSGNDWTSQAPTPGTWNITGLEKHHTFYPAGDADFIAFNASAGRSYLAETMNLVNGADTIIDILSSDGTTVLASNDDYGSTRASRLVWTASADGRYFVRSRRFDGRFNLARYGSYELRILESRHSPSIALPTVLTVSRSSQGAKFGSISDALSAAANGDTIRITDSGTYYENITISGKSIILKASSGKNPILDGRGGFASATLIISNAKSLKIDGLTIVGGPCGIRINSGAVTIVNSVIQKASDPAGYSDGIQVAGSNSSASIVNSTIVNNGRLGVNAFYGATARITNSIFQGNGRTDVGIGGKEDSLSVSNSLVQNPSLAGRDGNIAGDPGFVDAANGNFRITPSSPAIDRGDPSDPDLPATDADGIPRSLDGGSGRELPDMGAYEYLSLSSLKSISVLPQIAAGGDSPAYETSIAAFNLNATPATVHISLVKSDASPFPAAAPGRSDFNLSIPPSGSARFELSASGGTTAGYARLLSNLPIFGSALFKTHRDGNVLSEAGVNLSLPAQNFTVYIDNRNDAVSGYAIANFGTNPANLALILRDQDGKTRETGSLMLPAGRHFAEFAFQRFPNQIIPGFEGSIEVSSDQPISAVALRYDNATADVFSTIPVLAGEAATTLYFPQAADGGGYRTNFILVNPSDSPATAKLDFFDDDGNPMAFPIGGAPRTDYELPVAAKGVGRFSTDGTSNGVKVGWVRVSANVAIGGSSIFQRVSAGRILSEAGVASSPVSPHIMSYIESLGAAQSGLAICNPNAGQVSITLKLRNSDGLVVASNSFSLPPNGHIARFFTQWFPAGTDQFSGTLEVLATAPVSGVALRYDNPEQNVFATTPVIPIP